MLSVSPTHPSPIPQPPITALQKGFQAQPAKIKINLKLKIQFILKLKYIPVMANTGFNLDQYTDHALRQ